MADPAGRDGWLGTWFAQSVTGPTTYNSDRFDHELDSVGWWEYLGTPTFWETTLQNWQSEFLAVGSMAILGVYLRQRGSPESEAGRRAAHRDGHGELTSRGERFSIGSLVRRCRGDVCQRRVGLALHGQVAE